MFHYIPDTVNPLSLDCLHNYSSVDIFYIQGYFIELDLPIFTTVHYLLNEHLFFSKQKKIAELILTIGISMRIQYDPSI